MHFISLSENNLGKPLTLTVAIIEYYITLPSAPLAVSQAFQFHLKHDGLANTPAPAK